MKPFESANFAFFFAFYDLNRMDSGAEWTRWRLCRLEMITLSWRFLLATLIELLIEEHY